jgi:hypothetical protein
MMSLQSMVLSSWGFQVRIHLDSKAMSKFPRAESGIPGNADDTDGTSDNHHATARDSPVSTEWRVWQTGLADSEAILNLQ